MRENNKNEHCTHKDKERKYIRVMANLFSITIGWLCVHFIGAACICYVAI